jgi:ABC-type transport system substrate-binding protein
MFRGDFDLAISTWASGYDPDNSAVYGCAYVPPNGYNWARYCSPDMEAAQNAALSTFDERRRKAAYDTVEGLAIRDLPHFVLWWPVNVQFVNRDFRGFNPSIVDETFGAQLWDI